MPNLNAARMTVNGDKFSPPGGGGEIRLGDCFEHIAGFGDNTVDFVLTDPPYFLDGFGGDWDKQKLGKRLQHNGAIRSMPAGMKFDPRQGRDFGAFFAKLSAMLIRVIKPGGFFVSFSSGRLYHRMATAAEDAGFEIRDMLAWRYEGQAKAFAQEHFVRKRAISEEEKARILQKLGGRKTPQLKPQMEPMMLAQKPREGTFVDNWMKWEVGLMDCRTSLDGKFPGTVMAADKEKGGRKNGHLTVKPVRLCAHLIRLLTSPGQTVLDPFLGSGTTAVAAMMTGRKCLGFEIDRDYFAAAAARIGEEARKLQISA